MDNSTSNKTMEASISNDGRSSVNVFQDMTFRDYFACYAIKGLMAIRSSLYLNGSCRDPAYCDQSSAKLIAKAAYTIADEMMKARAE